MRATRSCWPLTPVRLPSTPTGPPQEFNETFFCDQAACYGYNKNATIWPLARQACKRGGGDLARLDSFDKQVALEAYFADNKVLNASFYWIGIGRVNFSSPYRWVQGDRAPVSPNRFPYAHWTWFQVSSLAAPAERAWAVLVLLVDLLAGTGLCCAAGRG